MTLERARTIAERLLDTFGLDGWSVRFVNFPPLPAPRRRLGLCCYADRTVYLSIEHVEQDPDDYIIETLVEEVGHALSPGDTNHGPRWKSARDRVWQTLLELDASVPRNALWYVRNR